MPQKYFDFIEKKELTKQEIAEIESSKQKVYRENAKKIQKKNAEKIKQSVNLKNVYGRVIIAIDLDYKNAHTFSNGEKIYIGRQFNNLNRRETEPVNAKVISSDYIPANSDILIHQNAAIDTNKIFGFSEDDTTVRYYSIPEDQCYLWKDKNGEWKPLKGYATGVRVFQKHEGLLTGIPHKQLKNVLFMTSGEFENKAVRTLNACDYEIVFMGDNGQEERIIRLRHYENEINEREEIVCVDENITQKIEKRELLIGNSVSDAKYLIFTL